MKKLILFLFTILAISNVNAQSQTEKRENKSWSLGLILASGQRTSFSNFSTSIFDGIVIRKKTNLVTYRLGLEHRMIVDKEDGPECCDQMTSRGYVRINALRLGIERQVFQIGFLQSYVGVDLSGFRSKSFQIFEGGIAPQYLDAESKSNGLSLTPLLGLGAKLSSRFSIKLESRYGLNLAKSTFYALDLYDPAALPIRVLGKRQMSYSGLNLLTVDCNF